MEGEPRLDAGPAPAPDRAADELLRWAQDSDLRARPPALLRGQHVRAHPVGREPIVGRSLVAAPGPSRAVSCHPSVPADSGLRPRRPECPVDIQSPIMGPAIRRAHADLRPRASGSPVDRGQPGVPIPGNRHGREPAHLRVAGGAAGALVGPDHRAVRGLIRRLHPRHRSGCHADRLAADADRRRWLEVIAAFLRHELKNSMAAIGSSIDMAERVAPDPDTKAGAGSRLMVSDIGDALPPDSTRIFEPFVTEKGAEPGAGHLGLGLFVARAIAINHGGSLRAEPLCDPVGARFIVELPLLASPAGA